MSLTNKDLQKLTQIIEVTFDKKFDEAFDRKFDEAFDRKFDEAFDRKFDEAFDRKFNEAFDRKFDEAFDKKFDEAFDRKFDEAFDRKFDEKFSENFNKHFDLKFDEKFDQRFDEKFAIVRKEIISDFIDIIENRLDIYHQKIMKELDKKADKEDLLNLTDIVLSIRHELDTEHELRFKRLEEIDKRTKTNAKNITIIKTKLEKINYESDN